jgi:putative FmdB family regulatory protein
MAIYEYSCRECDPDVVFERRVHMVKRDEQFCRECGTQLDLRWSRPASFHVGRYGKGGGDASSRSMHEQPTGR